MTKSDVGRPPTADEIERWFSSPQVVWPRPALEGVINALRVLRRFRWQAEGLESLSRLERPVIFAANHQSHVDTAAIVGTVPRHIRRRLLVAAALDVFGTNGTDRPPSLKREALQWVVASAFHAFAFDRHGAPHRSIRTSVDLLRCGWSLLLYPEGTRSRTGELQPFKAGVGVLARFTGRPVVPIYTEGGRNVLPIDRFLPQPGVIQVRYGSPLWFETGETPEDFTERLEQRIRAMAAAPVVDGGQTRPAGLAS